jgi:hypothetical protein
LILAQNERWRRGLGMQVERGSNTQWRPGQYKLGNLPESGEQRPERGANTACGHGVLGLCD